MQTYKFQYYKKKQFVYFSLVQSGIILFLSICGAYLKINVLPLIAIWIIVNFLLYRLFKNYYYGFCTSKINDTQIEFELQDHIRIINFSDLVSYQVYHGNQGSTRLQLKTSVQNFNITGRDSPDFEIFCKDLIAQLNNYKAIHNNHLIHVNYSYGTRNWLYFLVLATLVYLIAFVFETNALRIAIGIGGGLFLLTMWSWYFYDKQKYNSSNRS